MKLAVILSRVPYPLDKGDKLRAYHQIKQLSIENDIYLFCLTEQDISFDVKEHLLGFCKDIYIYPMSRKRSLLNTIRAIFTGNPFQVEYFYCSKIHKTIAEKIYTINPDYAIFQLIRTAEYAKGIKPRKAIDYMDTFSIGFKRMAEKSFGIQRWFFKNESSRLKKYEKDIFSLFQVHFIISEQDRRYIDHPQKEEIGIVPNGVDFDYFNPIESIKKFDLVFHGNMNYLPNVNCAIYIAEKIIPEMERRGYRVSLLLSGATPNKKVRKLGVPNKIMVTGWVDDVRTSYCLSKIFIAPLEIGSGMQNKLLEAMAMGIPVVTSKLAASALNLKHNEHLLIGNSLDEYCNHIEQLLNNHKMAERLVKQSLEYIKLNYRWKDKADELQLLLNNKNVRA